MDLRGLGAQTCGVWTRRDALELLSPGQVRAHLGRGEWQVVLHGVYADAGHVLDAAQRAYAAVLASGGRHHPAAGGGAVAVAACGRTAARVWGLPLVDDDDPATGAAEAGVDDVQVRGARRARSTTSGVLRRHDLVLQPGDLRRLPSGLVLTCPLRTLVHCASLLRHEALVCALDDALHRRLVTASDLDAAVQRFRGEPGSPALRAAVAVADGRAESPAETLARLLLLPVLPTLEPQVELRERWGHLVARFDLGDRRARFAVEVDGKRGHAGTAMWARDRARDRRTGAYGWTTERVTWFELRRQPDAVRRRLLAAHAAHVARVGVA